MSSNRSFTTVLGAGALALGLVLAPAKAAAQEPDPVDPTGKGITGGILLGAEIVMIPIGIAGVDAWWPYVVFGLVGAGGGAIGGCALEGSLGACSSFMTTEIPPEAALGVLAGGMALVIPTLVVVLNATAYDPEKETQEGEEGSEEGAPVTEPKGEGEETEGKRRIPPPAFIGVDATGRRTRVRPGVPAVEVKPMYTPREQAMWGVEAGTEVQFPLVRGRF